MKPSEKELHRSLKAAYLQGGMSHQEISEKFKITYTAACGFYNYYKSEYAFPPMKCVRKQSSLFENVEMAYWLYSQGSTLEEVGKVFGVSRERVRQVFEAIGGMPSRKAGRNKKYLVCKKGHQLRENEYRHTCKTCAKESKERREKGLYTRTHCKWGHEFTEDNLYWYPLLKGGKGRRCKICMYEKSKAYNLRKKNAK